MADTGSALVVGASRGLGLGLARALLAAGWAVTATEREGRPSAELHALAEGGGLGIETVDVADAASVAALGERLAGARLDLLFVNAGVMAGGGTPAARLGDEEWSRAMITNALGPMRVIDALDGATAPDATVAAMTSQLGSVGDNRSGGYETYRAGKAALNILLRSYAAQRAGRRTVLAVHPGWVRTDMGGAGASLGVEESVAGILATIAARRGRGGCAFVDHRNKELIW